MTGGGWPPPPVACTYRRVLVALALVVACLTPQSVSAQDEDEQHQLLFWISEDYIKDLAAKNTIRYPLTMRMDDRSAVHDLAADCEIHVAWAGAAGLASPSAVVAEPPNLCKIRLPGVGTGSLKKAWAKFFDDNVMNQECTVVGFPRIFAEHVSGGGGAGSNADHVLEIHPALSISCPSGTSLDFSSALKVFPGMRRITDDSAAECLDKRRLWVRKGKDEDTKKVRYEFAEEGAKGPGGRCGNFALLEATIHPDFIRPFDMDAQGKGEHSAIAWVTAGSNGPFSLKIYTYRGTPEDTALEEIDQGINPNRKLLLHGLFTYDYFTIMRTVQDKKGNWLAEIDDWKEVRHPLAFVVYGTVPQ